VHVTACLCGVQHLCGMNVGGIRAGGARAPVLNVKTCRCVEDVWTNVKTCRASGEGAVEGRAARQGATRALGWEWQGVSHGAAVHGQHWQQGWALATQGRRPHTRRIAGLPNPPAHPSHPSHRPLAKGGAAGQRLAPAVQVGGWVGE